MEALVVSRAPSRSAHHVDAERAAVEVRGAQLDEFEQRGFESALGDRFVERLHRADHLGRDARIVEARLGFRCFKGRGVHDTNQDETRCAFVTAPQRGGPTLVART